MGIRRTVIFRILALLAALTLGACGGSDDAAPQITAQPASITVAEGTAASFTVAASGSGALSYQWRRNGVDVAGATSATYSIASAAIGDTGAVLSVLVTASAGSTASAAATLTVNGASASQTIGPAGGSLSFTSNGTNVTVTVPAGALAANTVLSLQSLAPNGSQIARVGLQPIGVSFAKPVSIALQMPATRIVKATTVASLDIAGRKAFVPTLVDVTARTATTQVLFFGMQSGVTPSRFAGSGVRVAQASRAHALDAPAPSSGTLTLEELAVLQPQADIVTQAVADLQASGRFQDAATLQLSIAALVQSGQVPEWQIDAAPLIRGAASSVCIALAQAINVAQGTTIATYGDYQRVAKDIVYWESASQALGADACPGTAWSDVLHAKLQEALAFIEGKVQPPPAPSGYSPVGNEIRSATDLGAQATLLYVTSVAADTRSLYVDPAVMPLRVAAFGTSQTSTDQSEYLTLLTALGPVQALSDDAQFAATTFTATTKSASGATLDSLLFGRGAAVGAPVKTGTLHASTDGTVELAGSIAVLHCPDAAAERLQVLFEGMEVANIASNADALLGTSPTLPPLSTDTLLRTAGIAPQNAAQHQLVVKRLNSPCASAFEIVDDTLALITLDFTQPPMMVQVFFARGVVGDGIVAPEECRRATDLPFPFSFAFGPCAGATGAMTLALSDPRTIAWSLDAVVSNDVYFTEVLFNVTFAKAGTVTLSVNPAWVKSSAGCGPSNFYGVAGRAVLPFAAGLTGGTPSLTPWAKYDVCSNPDLIGPNLDSTSLTVTAGQTLGFYVAALSSAISSMTGSGTAFTWHFEPSP